MFACRQLCRNSITPYLCVPMDYSCWSRDTKKKGRSTPAPSTSKKWILIGVDYVCVCGRLVSWRTMHLPFSYNWVTVVNKSSTVVKILAILFCYSTGWSYYRLKMTQYMPQFGVQTFGWDIGGLIDRPFLLNFFSATGEWAHFSKSNCVCPRCCAVLCTCDDGVRIIYYDLDDCRNVFL